MSDNTVCNLCDRHGTIDQATEVAAVSCDVSKFQHEKFTVWRCRFCDSLHSKEDVDLERYYTDYFLHDQKLDFVTKTVYRRYIKAMKRCGLRRQHAILDYGCGNGLMLRVLRQQRYRNASGYDPYVADFSDPQVLKRSYDAVIACEVIEHMADPQNLMRDLAARVRTGGILAVATPDASGIDLQGCDQFQWGLHQPFHRHILSHKVMEQLGRRVSLNQLYLSRRSWDTLWPTVNLRFLVEYIRAAGNFADVVIDEPRLGMVLTSPRLLFFAAYGCFFSPQSSMLAIFRKQAE